MLSNQYCTYFHITAWSVISPMQYRYIAEISSAIEYEVPFVSKP